jgi:hypothetical protein
MVLSVFLPTTKSWAASSGTYGCVIGSSSSCPGDSALQIKQATGTNTDGVYWVKVNGTATQIYCIMNSAMDGGGWMMVMKAANTGTTFNYSANYWTETSTTLNTSYTRRNDASYNEDAKFNTFNYSTANKILAIFPGQTAGGGITGQTYGFTWLESTTASNQTMISLFNGPEYKIRDAIASSPYRADGPGIFTVETGITWFGYNFTSGGANNYTRFGIGTNNENYWGSNDTRGGIGLDYGTWSAGDASNCCAVTSGVLSQMKFEMYVKNTATTLTTANPSFSAQTGTAGGATFSIDTSTVSADTVTVSAPGRTLSLVRNANGSYSVTGALANDVITVNVDYVASSGYKGYGTISTTITATTGASSTVISVGSVNKLINNTITVNVSPAAAGGNVTFYWNRRQITRCVSKPVVSGSVTCTWKPLTQGSGVLTATFTATDNIYTSSSANPVYLSVGKRTGSR